MFGPVLREMLRTGATLGHHPTVHIAVESSAATPGTTVLDAVARAPHDRADEPFEPVGGAAASNLINVPALTTLVRSFAAQYYGDAEATAAFATQTLAEIRPGERLLSANAQVFLAVAEWLRGQAHRGRTRHRVQRHRVARDRPAHNDRVELPLAGTDPACPGPPDAAVQTCEQALDTLVTAGRPAPAAGPGYVGLADIAYQREREILVLLAAGTPNPRIAEELVVSLDTVKKHVSHLLGKLGAANRTEAVTQARQLGLIPRDSSPSKITAGAAWPVSTPASPPAYSPWPRRSGTTGEPVRQPSAP